MNPTRILAVARRIVHQFRRDRPTLALLFIAPIALLALIAPLLDVESDPPTIGIVGGDGALGAQMAEVLAESDALVSVAVANEAEALAQLEATTLDGFLVLPELNRAAMLAGGEIDLRLHVRGDDAGESGRIGQALSSAMRDVMTEASPVPLPQVSLEVVSLYGEGELKMLDLFAPGIIGFFVFFLVFLLTCISFLRERVNGTMERLLQSPISRLELVLGYMLGFALFALAQGAVMLAFSLYGLQVYNAGNLALVFLIEALLIVGAVNLGIYLSTFARTELQVVQFIPLVISPQVVLSGLLFSVETLPSFLQPVARLLPLTYAIDALRAVMLRGEGLADIAGDIGALLLFAALMVVLGAFTLRREVA